MIKFMLVQKQICGGEQPHFNFGQFFFLMKREEQINNDPIIIILSVWMRLGGFFIAIAKYYACILY